MKRLLYACCLLLAVACTRQQPHPDYTIDVMNRYTPVKDQGRSQTCWAYAMLAAIETEHIGRGDSVNLSPAWVEKKLELVEGAPASKRAMGQTCLNIIQQYGLCAYDAMRTVDTPEPRWVFMYGMQYTPLEFAHSVCAPDEYVALTSTPDQPYYIEVEPDVPDNWEHNRMLNLPMDTLLLKTEQAVARHHGVCWESSRHAMSIVGLAHDSLGVRLFVMKNSWGADRALGGLELMPVGDFRRQTVAVYMTREAFGQ